MVHSEIGDFTWPGRRVVRDFGKANSYWLTMVQKEQREIQRKREKAKGTVLTSVPALQEGSRGVSVAFMKAVYAFRS